MVPELVFTRGGGDSPLRLDGQLRHAHDRAHLPNTCRSTSLPGGITAAVRVQGCNQPAETREHFNTCMGIFFSSLISTHFISLLPPFLLHFGGKTHLGGPELVFTLSCPL